MKIAPPPAAVPPSLKQQHERKCFLFGITEPETVAVLWGEFLERQKKQKPKKG